MRSLVSRDLSEICNYLTLGIDGVNKNEGTDDIKIKDETIKGKKVNGAMSIQLVVVYDLKNDKIFHWTGKSYPTS